MLELLGFLSQLIGLYEIVIIAAILLQMLLQHNRQHYANPMVRSIAQGLQGVTEPLLKPIRARLPKNSTGIDFAPLVLILACVFLRSVVIPNIAKAF